MYYVDGQLKAMESIGEMSEVLTDVQLLKSSLNASWDFESNEVS